jgi:hypothetical protein
MLIHNQFITLLRYRLLHVRVSQAPVAADLISHPPRPAKR